MAVCTLVEVSFCVVYSRSLVEHAILKVDAGAAFLRTFFGDMIAGGWGSLSIFSDPTRRFPPLDPFWWGVVQIPFALPPLLTWDQFESSLIFCGRNAICEKSFWPVASYTQHAELNPRQAVPFHGYRGKNLSGIVSKSI